MTKLIWLALGAFAIGTEGYAIAGLLPTVAADLHVTLALAGQLITAFSLAFALGSPLLAVATGGVERKRLLIGSMALFGVFNLLAAAAHTYGLLLAARVGLALAAGVFMPAASAYAVAAAPAAQRGRALSIIYAGLTVATLVGVPIGVLIGGRLGWRFVFVAAAGLSFATLIGLTALKPSRGGGATSLKERIAVARRPEVLGALVLTVAFMTGVYSLYTYFASFLQQVAGLGGDAVAVVLFQFGVGATIGNLVAGRVADRVGPVKVITFVLLGLSIIFSLISVAAVLLAPEVGRWVVLPAVALWGIVGFSFPTAQQTRLVALHPRLAPITLSLNASAGYIGVSLGAILGSVVVAHHAVADLGWVAAACEFTALLLLLFVLPQPSAVAESAPVLGTDVPQFSTNES